METRKLFTFFAITAVVVELATAATHTVGAPNGGWDTSTDLKTWADSQQFLVGDTLVFQYGATHDVTEVSKGDYDNCQTTNATNRSSSGNTVIQLTSAGMRYFICTTPGHCQQGMKLEVNTTAASSPATPPSSSPTAPPPSNGTPSSPAPPAESSPTPPTSTPSVPTPPSNTAEPPNSSVHLAIGFCFSMMVMMLAF